MHTLPVIDSWLRGKKVKKRIAISELEIPSPKPAHETRGKPPQIKKVNSKYEYKICGIGGSTILAYNRGVIEFIHKG